MTPEQRRHRVELLGALEGPAIGDEAWQEITAAMWGPPPPPKRRRDRHRVRAAEGDQPRAVCPACLARHHGRGCDGPPCACRCRATLGLNGPFGVDPTAPSADEIGGRVA